MWGIRLVVLTSQAELAQKILESEFESQEWDSTQDVDEFENNIE
jgi:hypothetical protein